MALSWVCEVTVHVNHAQMNLVAQAAFKSYICRGSPGARCGCLLPVGWPLTNGVLLVSVCVEPCCLPSLYTMWDPGNLLLQMSGDQDSLP